jgi:hypothetical protein
MGYNFCGRGSFIYHPDPRTCDYFACVAKFESGTGFMVECADGRYSLSGGRTAVCASHGGASRPVYSGP